ncbi:MAG TPA: hypothetical protein VN228_15390 [Pyrinomonadaceae bacterium]|nr:hypothetical protein [Pyrinomonadaceae bacterium]
MRFKLATLTLVAVTAFALTIPAAPPPAAAAADPASEQIRAMMTRLNDQLAASGAPFRADYAEYITGGDAAGQTVFFNNRGNKQLAAHFVPGDPRRGGATNITYIIDQTEGAPDALTTAQTNAAIDRAMATWDGVNCSHIPITKLPDIPGTDLGVIEFQNGLGGSPFVFADITHAGWLPGGILAPNVIAVTFTFIFINPDSTPTDIDNNGKADTAFREILYNNAFVWNINADIDVETIALHEAGHGLSQGHFGKAFITNSNGKLHFSPLAVMNAAYSGVQQNLAGTDNAGHCSIWGSWPNN